MKITKTISLAILLALSLTVSAAAFEPVEGDMTEQFTLEMVETAPILDGVLNDGEYELITSYTSDNEDWFITDYSCVRQYAGEGMPDYTIDVYGSWDTNGVYVAVKTDCPEHKINTDPVWNGCGVMIGFVAEDPASGVYDTYADYNAMGDVLQETAYNYASDGTLNLNNTTNDAVHGENVNTVYKHADGYDVYEMYFTWDFIGCEPAMDKVIGLGMMISKNNAEAADGIDWVCFQSDVVNAKLPQTYTRLVLEDNIVPGNEAEIVETPESAGTAPQTFDVSVIAAVTAVISAAGYAISKKR